MKKKLLFLMLSVLTLGAWAQTSPYTGVAVSDIVSGNDYYLYNVESGLWLQNNDRTTNDWHTRGQLGTRGIDLQLNADGAGYKINAKFGRSSINHENLYLDANDNDVWVFESVTVGSVSNAVTISCSGTVLGARNYVRTYKAKNLFTEETESNYYLENQANEGTKNNTWQIVTKEERLDKMAAATESSPMDASWLVKSSDFANNDSRYSSWKLTGSWARGGDAKGDWGRGSMIMESWNSGDNVQISQVINDVPNGKYELQLQGYYRDGMAGDNTDFNERGCTNETCIEARHDAGTEVIRAKYFANATEADLRSIIDETHTSAKTGPDCWNFTRLGSYYFPNDMQTAQRAMNIEKAYVNDPIQVIVTDGILTIGVKKTGSAAYDWVILDNFKLTYLGPVVDLGPYLETLNNNIAAAEAYNGDTTDALASALASALATAKAARSSEDTDELSQAAHDLHSALEAAEAVDVSVLRPTVALAKAEGIDVAAQEAYLANGTTNEVADRLRYVQSQRKMRAMRYFDDATIASITGSEPTNGESYYLLNVGTGMFFACNSDWGTHMALDSKGFLVKLVADGERNGFTDYHISGKESVGWDGFNWTEEYFDKNGESKWHFIPVEGKTKVYNIAIYDNHNWHIIYNPNNLTTDGDKYFNVLKKINGTGYESNPNAQWILLTPEQRTELLAKATDSNPIDATHLIENPNFNKSKASGSDDTKYGWTGLGTVGHYGRYADYVAEFFETTADAKTVVTGLPAGNYQVSVSGYYREKNYENDISVYNNGENIYSEHAHLVAYTDENNKVAAPFMHISAEHGKMPGVGNPWTALNGDYLPQEMSDAAQYFETGLYRITTGIITVGSDGQLTIGVEKPNSTGNDANWIVFDNFRLTYLGPTSESVTVSSDGYATYASDNALDFTDSSIKAFYAKESAGILSFTQVRKVPAGTGVLLYKEGGISKEEVPVFTGEADDVTGNVFVRGTGAAVTYAADNQNYILFKGEDGIGFYKANNNTVATNRAYIHVENGNGVKGFVINLEDDATGISDLKDSMDLNDSKVIYNLAGQRLSKTQKGINIVNGKKILK